MISQHKYVYTALPLANWSNWLPSEKREVCYGHIGDTLTVLHNLTMLTATSADPQQFDQQLEPQSGLYDLTFLTYKSPADPQRIYLIDDMLRLQSLPVC